jgi:hypothetical protein
MSMRKIDKAEWAAFCDAVSKSLNGKQAEIEIGSLAFGTRIGARSLPLLGIVYDMKNDMMEIILDGLDHMISHPRELCAEIGPGGLTIFEVIDGENAHQIVKLRDPLMLPSYAGDGGQSPRA